MDWARQEGWNPGPHDAEVFYRTDPDGFYGYFHQGELIAGGSVVSYEGEFGFMGFFIVKPEYRGTGIGRQLWFQRRDLLLSRLRPGASIGMEGVVDMQAFYAKGGFRLVFRDERYRRNGESFPPSPGITLLTADDFPAALKYDRQCFGFKRETFLKNWLTMPESFSFKASTNGRLTGMAHMRKATDGYKIGPLFADSPEIAEALYRACLSAAPGDAVFLDIPVINQAACQLVKSYNAEYVFECGRMYYGPEPKLPLPKIFGVTTFELG
ncbi:GNAT family N-acetyltransferase [Mangrovibacterium diazotrophicum]|uniref:GNAT family N-acetyltransferase n=1 Tax=Mangrovibacterium diazotrophicum TaxID=1261403 RepID=UPI001B8643F8|nr:GNAT family N-acetyltransferase [Mangrovibacterium diazotrophicum]